MIPGAIYKLDIEHDGDTSFGWREFTLVERRASRSHTRTFERVDPDTFMHGGLWPGVNEDEELMPKTVSITCVDYEWSLVGDGEPAPYGVDEEELQSEIELGYYKFAGMKADKGTTNE